MLYARVSGRDDEGIYSYLYGLNRESYFISEGITSVGAASSTKDQSTDSATFFYTGTGSVSNLISENEDRFGISYTYDPFGNVTKNSIYEPVTIPDVTYEGGVRDLTDSFREYSNPYTYNAEYIHGSLGIQYLRARYYDAKAGSFISKDSYAGSVTDTISQNRYTYAQNNPVNYCDPSGHKPGNNSSKSKTCTAAEQARENALKANASRTGSSTSKASTSSALMGVPSDVRKILEERNSNGHSGSEGLKTGSKYYNDIERSMLIANNSKVDYLSLLYNVANEKALYLNAIKCAAYEKCHNKVQELIPGKDLDRIINGIKRIRTGSGFVRGGSEMMAAGMVLSETGVGVSLVPVGAVTISAGLSTAFEGAQDIYLGWKGDSKKVSINPVRETWFGGREYDGIFIGVFSLEEFLGDMAIMSFALPSGDKTDLNPSSEAKVISETPTVETSVPEGPIGGRNSDVNISKRNTPDQDALIQLAKELKKNGGATYEDAEILIDWAKEYNVPYHEIEVHPNRPGAASNVPHFHIGKTGHIPIIGDIPTWLEEVLYDN